MSVWLLLFVDLLGVNFCSTNVYCLHIRKRDAIMRPVFVMFVAYLLLFVCFGERFVDNFRKRINRLCRKGYLLAIYKEGWGRINA